MHQTRPQPNVNEPECWFAHPSEIVESSDLTQGQKYLALDRWQTLLEVRLRKSHSPSAADVALHQAVIKARRTIASPSYWWPPNRNSSQRRNF